MSQSGLTGIMVSLHGFFFATLLSITLGQVTIRLGPDIYHTPEELRNCEIQSDPTQKGVKIDDYLYVSIMDIDQIMEDNMEYRLHAYIVDQWKNPMINFSIIGVKDPDAPILLPPKIAECMWKPDVIFPNSKDIKTFKAMVPNRSYKFMTDETIYRVERYLFKVNCPMDFHLFPLDSQHCTFKIGLMHNPDNKVTLHWVGEEGSPKTMVNHSAFKMIDKVEPLHFIFRNPRPVKEFMPWHTGNYTELWGNFSLYRRLTGSVVNLYFPSTIVVSLSWLSFWIDVSAAPARVTIGVTALLTIVTQIAQSRTLLPPVHYITGLDVWLFACLILIFGSLIEYGIAYSFQTWAVDPQRYKISPIEKNSPPAVKAWSPITKSQSSQTSAKSHKDETTANSRSPPSCQKPLSLGFTNKPFFKLGGNNNPFDKTSRWIFPFLTLIFSIVYWSVLFILAD